MSSISRAEAVLSLDRACSPEAIEAAKAAGAQAAVKTQDLIPFCPPAAHVKAAVAIEAREDAARIETVVEADSGSDARALAAASIAALALCAATKAFVQCIRLIERSGEAAVAAPVPVPVPIQAKVQAQAQAPAPALAAHKTAPVRAKPATLIGEVAAPRPQPAGNANKREAFRTFMTNRHLRATEWAKQAGVPAALVYAYLTGRTGAIPADVAEKLANTARVRVEDMFK